MANYKADLAFIGFGEAAYNFSVGLKRDNDITIVAYDVFQDDEKRSPLIRQRAAQAGVELMPTVADACASAPVIFTLTSGAIALSVAKANLPYLKAGQIYVDMNAASPLDMEKMDKLPERPEGVLICDVAVMGPIPVKQHKVPMLLAGDGAAGFKAAFESRGMDLTVLDAACGGASAIKLFRSVVAKGIPQLLLEAMLPAAKYGALDALLSSLNDTFYQKTVEQWCDTLLGRTIVHSFRRVHEMDSVVASLEDMGMDATMSKATKSKLEKMANSGLADQVPNGGIIPYKEAIQILLDNGVV